MTITRESIEERKTVLENDIISARQRVAEYDKRKTEDVALLNAITVALQQCEQFLKEFDNEKPVMAGDDGNDED